MAFGSSFGSFALVLGMFFLFAGIIFVHLDHASTIATTPEEVAKPLLLNKRNGINITRVFNHSGLLTLHVENSGNQELEVNKTFVFVNGARMQLSEMELTLFNGTDIRSPGLWSPAETIVVNTTKILPECGTQVKVVDQYGTSDSDSLPCNLCRAESKESIISSGNSEAFHRLNRSVQDMSQAFLFMDATGTSGIQGAADHMVSGYLYNSTHLHFQRVGTPASDVFLSFALVECFNREFFVQRNETAITPGNSFTTVDLNTTVDTGRSIVLVNSRVTTTGASEYDALVTGELTDSDTVYVERATTSAETTTARFEVVEFDESTDVEIHMGEITLSSGAASVSDTLSSAVNLNTSFLYCSWDATDDGLQQAAVGCELTDENTVTFYREAASAFTNRIRYYIIEWPSYGFTVNVQRGSVLNNDPPNADDVRYNLDINISAVNTTRAFPFITNTVEGSGTAFPRNHWIQFFQNSTVLNTSFWRGSSTFDINDKYWQVVEFVTDTSNPR